MHLAFVAAPADIAVEVLEIGGLKITPAALVQSAGGDIDRCVAALAAVLDVGPIGVERATGQLALTAVIGEAILELHVQRTAEGVQAEHRVRAFQVQLIDCQAGQQVEIDRVAKALIEADTVDIHSQTLRCPCSAEAWKPW